MPLRRLDNLPALWGDCNSGAHFHSRSRLPRAERPCVAGERREGGRHMTADIASLTPDELRRRIADRLGYTVRNFHDPDEPDYDQYWILCDPKGYTVMFEHHDPNWPGDPDDHYTGDR